MTVEVRDTDSFWKEYLEIRHKSDFYAIGNQYPFRSSLIIDYDNLYAYGKRGTQYATELLQKPDRIIDDIKSCINTHRLIRKNGAPFTEEINIRFIHLPRKKDIHNLRFSDVGSFITIEGIVRKRTDVRPRIVEGVYVCPAGHRTRINQPYGVQKEPDRCSADGCTFRKLELVPHLSTFVDSQKIRIQEAFDNLSPGSSPESIDIELMDIPPSKELTNLVNPGTRIVVNGVLRMFEKHVSGKKSTAFQFYLECNSVEITDQDFTDVSVDDKDISAIKRIAKQKDPLTVLAKSYAPAIFGMGHIKEAITLQLFGGCYTVLPDGKSKMRGDMHVLLVGDPGLAKSEMIRYALNIAPRAIFTSGKGTSAAGLTATAVKDEFGDGGWTLEAGALVLADKGICIIDEICRMDRRDMSALHQALEQQEISIAKAGIIATLPTRASLLAAANPKYGKIDQSLPFGEQIEMEGPLLSRFDLIYLLPDVAERNNDMNVALHILNARSGSVDKTAYLPEVSPELFRKYIAYAKSHYFPRMDKESVDYVAEYYTTVRDLGNPKNKSVPITPRQLIAVARLAESIARLRLSNHVSHEDCVRAIGILDKCLREIAYDNGTGLYDVSVVMTGKSQKIHTLTALIEQQIKNLAQMKDGLVSPKDVVSSLLLLSDVASKYTESDILTRIEAMLRGGRLYNPKGEFLRVVK